MDRQCGPLNQLHEFNHVLVPQCHTSCVSSHFIITPKGEEPLWEKKSSPEMPLKSHPSWHTKLAYYGTTVTLRSSRYSPLDVRPTRWEIVNKIHERANFVNQPDVTNGLGPSRVTGKFLCRPASPSDPNALSFMRIYKQIPIRHRV